MLALRLSRIEVMAKKLPIAVELVLITLSIKDVSIFGSYEYV